MEATAANGQQHDCRSSRYYVSQPEEVKASVLLSMAVGLPGWRESTSFTLCLRSREHGKTPRLRDEAWRRYGLGITNDAPPKVKGSKREEILEWLDAHPVSNPDCVRFLLSELQRSLQITLPANQLPDPPVVVDQSNVEEAQGNGGNQQILPMHHADPGEPTLQTNELLVSDSQNRELAVTSEPFCSTADIIDLKVEDISLGSWCASVFASGLCSLQDMLDAEEQQSKEQTPSCPSTRKRKPGQKACKAVSDDDGNSAFSVSGSQMKVDVLMKTDTLESFSVSQPRDEDSISTKSASSSFPSSRQLVQLRATRRDVLRPSLEPVPEDSSHSDEKKSRSGTIHTLPEVISIPASKPRNTGLEQRDDCSKDSQIEVKEQPTGVACRAQRVDDSS